MNTMQSLKALCVILVLGYSNISSAQPVISKIINWPCPTNNIVKPGWTLVFNDEFTAPTVNSTNWHYYEGVINSWDPLGLMYLTASSSNTYIDDGNLILAARREDMGGMHYTSSWIYTDPIEYGYFEIKCQIPKGNCLFPAFWLVMPFGGIGNSYQEIDVFEMDGSDTKRYQNNIWHGTVDERHQNNMWIKPKKAGGILGLGIQLDLGDEFFIYGVEWTPNSVKYYLNNTLVRTITENIPYSALSLHLDLWLGGAFVDPDCESLIEDVSFPKYMQVDYVRSYKTTGDAIHIMAPSVICGNTTISVERYIQATYVWNIPAGLNVISGLGTNSLVVNPSTTGNKNISVTVTFPDGNTETKAITIYSTISAPSIPGNIEFSQFLSTCTYKADIPDVLGATSYEWSFNNFASVIETIDSELDEIFPGTYTLKVRAKNCVGTSGVKSKTQNLPAIGGGCLWKETQSQISQSEFNLNTFGNKLEIIKDGNLYNEKCIVKIFNLQGQLLITTSTSDGIIDLKYLTSGVYICIINNGNNISSLKFLK